MVLSTELVITNRVEGTFFVRNSYKFKRGMDAMRKKKELIMTEGGIIKPLILFILPLIGSSIFQQLYNTADYYFVGNI